MSYNGRKSNARSKSRVRTELTLLRGETPLSPFDLRVNADLASRREPQPSPVDPRGNTELAPLRGETRISPSELRGTAELVSLQREPQLSPLRGNTELAPLREQTQLRSPLNLAPLQGEIKPPPYNLRKRANLSSLQGTGELPPLKGWKPRPMSSKPCPDSSRDADELDLQREEDEKALLDLEREMQYQRLLREELNFSTWRPRGVSLPAASSTTAITRSNTPMVAVTSTTTTTTSTTITRLPHPPRNPHPPMEHRKPHPPFESCKPRPPNIPKTNITARDIIMKQKGDGKMYINRHSLLTARLRKETHHVPSKSNPDYQTVQDYLQTKPHPPAPYGHLLCKRAQIGNTDKTYVTSDQGTEFFHDRDDHEVKDEDHE